ncbi:MAG: transpeptidase family protein [Dysgonamonadaceae bacterium]|nr:transpeptidase family protein [Dysgonamonadaceae bacterium]
MKEEDEEDEDETSIKISSSQRTSLSRVPYDQQEKINNGMKKNKSIILGKYGAIVVVLLLFAVLIFISAAKIAFPSDTREEWRREGRRQTVREGRIILPKRGNIYTHDGRLLAASEPSYIITMDFWADGIVKDSILNHIDALSASLARKFPDRTATQYRNLMMGGWQTREREEQQIAAGNNVRKSRGSARIISRDINYADLKEIRSCPALNQSTLRNGLIAQERSSRVTPFNNLASRTIGNVFADLEKGGSSGLELRFDSLLRGENGVKDRQRIQGRWRDVIITPAKNGYDIITTLDAGIQDIAERSLRDMLIETNAESGTAIVMEVKTGAIRAITNLDRVRSGIYAEGSPNAFSWMHEPGSTFKTVAAMIALEDGVVQTTDSFLVGNGVWVRNNRLTVTDWDARRVNRGHYTLQRGMEMSSNVVMAKMLLQGYSDNPEKFVAGIDRIGLNDTSLVWDVPLRGREGSAFVRRPGDGFWSNATSLGVMSYGYETQIPPIRMLMFYNAIANNGKMIQPFIAQRIARDGRTIKEFSARVVNPNIFQKRTTREQIHEMLVGVVESGTATSIKSPYFDIAGKTGTAQLANRSGYGAGHFVSFAGYFPADNPEYTIFVGIRNPSGIPSGARHSGMVFKNIAEQIFVRENRLTVDHVRVDTTLATDPRLKNGKWQHNRALLSSLRMPVGNVAEASDWVRMQRDSVGNHQPRALAVETGVIPDVRGMGARDALYLLEKSGLRVNLDGSGRVISQTLSPGSRLARGATIGITLR